MRHEQGGPRAFHPDLVPVTPHSELTQQMFPKWSGSKTPTGGHSPSLPSQQCNTNIITTSFGSKTLPWQAFGSCIIPYLTQDNKILLSNFHKIRNYILQIEQISTQSQCSKTSCSMQARNWIRLIYHHFLQSSVLAISDQEYTQCPALREKNNNHHQTFGYREISNNIHSREKSSWQANLGNSMGN